MRMTQLNSSIFLNPFWLTPLVDTQFTDKNIGSNLPALSTIKSNGMSLEDLGHILRLFKCQKVSVRHTFQMEMDEFRKVLCETLSAGSQNSDSVVFVNYDLQTLGVGMANGHIAAVAGYNEKNDMCLLMDTMWMIGKCWIPLQTLYDAMNTIDVAVGKYRGCVIAEGMPLFN